MGRVRTIYTQEQKADALKLLASGLSLAAVEQKTGISDATLGKWLEKAQQEANEQQEASAKEQLDALRFKFQIVKLNAKYLRRLAVAKSDIEKKDIEIDYLRERLAKIFKDEWVKPLAELDDEDDDEDDEG